MQTAERLAPFPHAPTTGGVDERLLLAARRILGATAESQSGPTSDLRPEQARVFDDFATYLTDMATRPLGDARPSYCRIIQPPRTGKTVVAAHILARSGAHATFIVPTRTLVAQTVREMGVHAPGVSVGVFSGERKDVVTDGVNVTTYNMLLGAAKSGRIPLPIRESTLIFADEGHHAMTPRRLGVLRSAFDARAVRVALTATPDYDDDRRLAHYFADLVHEITLEEALDLGLLAPLRVWVAEVDVDASAVRFVAGDFEIETLGRLMSTGPFFRAIELFRYGGGNARMPSLIACSSRQQAYDLVQYLHAHRPPAAPEPQLLLGDTPGHEDLWHFGAAACRGSRKDGRPDETFASTWRALTG